MSADRATGAELASAKGKAHVVASSNFVAQEAGLGDWCEPARGPPSELYCWNLCRDVCIICIIICMYVCMYACMYVCTRKRFAVPTRYNNFVRNGVHIITHWEMVVATPRLGIARNKGIYSALPRKLANCVYRVFTQGSINSKSRKHLSIPDITSYTYS